ncbi:sensor histidine kinase [Massilia sp. DD77]|uniref:sensor histidine kinase n=1 Tax=Massilia sp. DD77 TaxID=3109349 RepID=UPI003000A4B0
MERARHRWPGPRVTLCLLVLALSLSRSAAAVPLDRLEHRRWIAAEEGPNQVGAIVQAPDGFLWLGTNDSLLRFDGARFVRFEPAHANSLNIVSALFADGPLLWVGLRYGGIRRIGAGKADAFPPRDGLPEGAVYGFARDRSGAVWAALDDGLARFDGQRWRTVDAAWGFPERKARAVFVDREGGLWAAGRDRLFYLAQGAVRFRALPVDVQWASQIAQAPDGALWIAERRRGRLHRVLLRGGAVDHAWRTLDAPGGSLLFDRAGDLWIGTYGAGILYLSAPRSVAALDTAQRFGVRDGLSSDVVWRLYADREGNIWAGTSAGLDRFRARTLVPAGLPPGALNVALAAGADGSLWAGAGNQPAVRLGPDGSLTAAGMPGTASAATTDAEGRVWMGGPAGIYRSEGRRLVEVAPLPAVAATESPVRALLRDAEGALWVSINRIGLFRWQSGRWKAIPPPTAAPSQRMPVVAAAEPGGRLWFGYRDNLAVSHGADGERQWTPADGLDIGHVTAIAHENGRTWLGGKRGLGVVEDGTFRRVGLPANGLFEFIYAILPVQGRGPGADLWLQSRSGIFQLEGGELRSALLDPGHRIRYRSYDLLGGLANDPFQVLPLPTGVRTSDGRLWFSASAGVAWIDPARPAADVPGPVVAIESVSVDGAPAPAGEPARLGASTRRVVFGYTAPSLSAPERINFRYRLDGYDRAWHDAGRQREAVYTGLGPGSYTFRVVAYNEEGAPSTSEARYGFRIEPAFYRRPELLALAAAVILSSLWLLHRANLRRAAVQLRQRLEARHEERERIARELHDTLLQGFNGLVLRMQVIANSLAADHPARAEIECVLDRADEVLVEGRDQVRGLRGVKGGRTTLAEALRAGGAELSAGRDAGFVFGVDGQPRHVRDEAWEEVYRIGYEALANAFAHAGASQVRATLRFGPGALELCVCDDGTGIPSDYAGPDGRPDHWGVRGMFERARQIGATLALQGAPGEGSRMRLLVPAKRAYRGGEGRWRLRKQQGLDRI